MQSPRPAHYADFYNVADSQSIEPGRLSELTQVKDTLLALLHDDETRQCNRYLFLCLCDSSTNLASATDLAYPKSAVASIKLIEFMKLSGL